MKTLILSLLLALPLQAEIKIHVVRVPGIRALKAREALKVVRIGLRDFLRPATGQPTTVKMSKLPLDPCASLNTLETRAEYFFCMRDYTDSLDLGVGYDSLYVMAPPIIEEGIEWTAGMGWICNNFALGNAVKKIFSGATFVDRWKLAVLPFAHEEGHNLGAQHTLETSFMSPDATFRAGENPWPLPVLEQTKQEIRECLG